MQAVFAVYQTHSCLRIEQLAAHHPQVGQREQRHQLRRVFLQSPVAHLHMCDARMRRLRLDPDSLCPQWNYTLRPRPIRARVTV